MKPWAVSVGVIRNETGGLRNITGKRTKEIPAVCQVTPGDNLIDRFIDNELSSSSDL